MTKIINFAMKIKGGGREGGTCEALRPCHPLKIWNVHFFAAGSKFQGPLTNAYWATILVPYGAQNYVGNWILPDFHNEIWDPKCFSGHNSGVQSQFLEQSFSCIYTYTQFYRIKGGGGSGRPPPHR